MVAQAQRLQANPTVGDVKNTNKIVDMAKRFKDEGIKLKKIDVNDMIILAIHDAAWANVDLEEEIDPAWDGDTKLSSQLACLIMVADRKVLENKEGNASFVDWRSRASTRVCRSTFAGETMACGEAMEAALYLRCLLLSFQQGRLVPEEEAGAFQEVHLCTDCKSLYDHLHREGVPKAPTERRLAIDLAAIRQSLKTEAIHQWKRRYGIGAVRPDKPCKPPRHWVPTEEQLADVLTKKMNPAQWWSAVRDGKGWSFLLPCRTRESQAWIPDQCECNSCLPCTHIGAIIFTTFHQPIDLTGCFSGTRQLFDFQVEKVGTWHLQCCDFDRNLSNGRANQLMDRKVVGLRLCVFLSLSL